MGDKYDRVPIPLSGVLDVRSMPELMGSGSVRYRENVGISTGRPHRRPMFTKFLSKTSGYNNEDFHDQMLGAQFYYGDQDPPAASADEVFAYPSSSCLTELKIRDNPREFVTLIFEVNSTTGYRKLILGTQSRLVELDEHNGTWRILADGLGGPTRDDLSIRFRAAQLKDTIVFTNDYDQPFSYRVGDRIQGCDLRATRKIEDLDVIRLTRAKEVAVFGDCIFFLNVVLDGGRIENAYLWSDLNDATSYDPSRLSSIATLQSIPFGNRISRADILLNQLVVYASRGIFSVAPGFANSDVKTWTALYESKDGSGMLAYPSTLVNSGDAHRYFGSDGIYKIDRFSYKPEREEWLHKGTGIIFQEIDPDICEAHCGGFWASATESGRDKEKEIHWSWVKRGNNVPVRSIAVQPDYKHVDYIDHGFTAYGSYRSSPNISAKDFFRQYCVCTPDELADESIKEGRPSVEVSCEVVPTVLVTDQASTLTMLLEWPADVSALELDGSDVPATFAGNPVNKDLIIEGRNSGTISVNLADTGTIAYAEENDGAVEPFQTEDYDGEAIDTSLCAVLDGATLGDICPSECPPVPIFIGASSRDKCLKQFGDAFSREICYNAGVADGFAEGFTWHNAVGIYGFEGYYSIIRLGPLSFKDKASEKNIRNVLLEMEAEAEVNKNVIALRLGYSYSQLDANKEDCGVVWTDFFRRELKCPQTLTPAEYRAQNLRPSFSGLVAIPAPE